MTLTILQALYFMLPAYAANMAPVLFKWIPFGGSPVHEKFFGAHKTRRGIVVGIFSAAVTIFLQRELFAFPFFKKISILIYPHLSSSIFISLGLAFGGGALLGDLLKSFFKRRLGIAAGRSWFPFDQFDFVIGALAAASIFYIPPVRHIIIIVILTPLLHFLVNFIAYGLKLKKVWW